MAHRPVRIWPDPILLQVAKPVIQVDESVQALVKDMIDTMYHVGDAAGIAAPQIGVSLRVFVADMGEDIGLKAFINPQFTLKEGSIEWEEGCLSIPGESGKVKRFAHVVVNYTDLEGKPQTLEAKDFLAVCLQHEYDHLEGKLWIDYQSRLKKTLVKKKMQKLKLALLAEPDQSLPYETDGI